MDPLIPDHPTVRAPGRFRQCRTTTTTTTSPLTGRGHVRGGSGSRPPTTATVLPATTPAPAATASCPSPATGFGRGRSGGSGATSRPRPCPPVSGQCVRESAPVTGGRRRKWSRNANRQLPAVERAWSGPLWQGHSGAVQKYGGVLCH